ncbi:Signal transduction histidine kinase [Perilla frutescens var. hirtella]|nr:Signal transduction histidine kinase [Perilla frutescens var. frutescens]KAH6793267.1 Signal transduction histidine kinase [Perilla frutescens var. hirtella]
MSGSLWLCVVLASKYEYLVFPDGYGKFRSRSWPLIIALTSNDDGDTRDKCLQIGMNGVIQKPGTFQEISEELKRILLQANRILA